MESQASRGAREGRPRVSIIIVLYNCADYIGPCVESLKYLTYPDVELIMLDNGSMDDSARLARDAARRAGIPCTISDLGSNRGFARANNLGFKLATGDIILLLNPDTEVYPDLVDALARAFEDDSVGVCGCKVYYPDRKTIQHAGGWVRDNGLTMHYGVGETDEGGYDEPRDCAYVMGAALAVRREVFTRAGMLDGGYYLAYFEDTDLCLNVQRMGFRVVFIPEARVVHHESTTTGKFTERYYYLYHRNRVRFMLKNFPWRFLMARAVPMEAQWLGTIEPSEQAVPLNKAYLANLVTLPQTLLARWRANRLLGPLPEGLTVDDLG